MARKRMIKLPPDGREVEATVVGFRSQGGEEFNQYLLDDGTHVKLKVVVTEVVRLEGEYDEFGNPAYIVRSQNIITVDAQEDAMRKEDGS